MERDYFLIEGGRKIAGEIEVRGAKNFALKALAASILFRDSVTVKGLPEIEDVSHMLELLAGLGLKVDRRADRSLRIETANISSPELDPEIAKKFRASVVLAGPLLAREKKVKFPHPGGCVIGPRPIDLFLEGWSAMGGQVQESDSGFEVSAPEGVRGSDFTFRNISVTATETMMMTATLARGETILRNAAREPEIPALAAALNKAGARIEGAGTSTVKIKGTGGELLNATEITVIPDRIEAGSFLILGALLGDPLKITRCVPGHLEVPIALLKYAGVPIEFGSDWITVSRAGNLKPVNMQTREYPGFPTDLQAPYTVLMTQAQGSSFIFETVFEGRLHYIEALQRSGANIITRDNQRVIVQGPTPLRGREVESPDIRAGLAFLIAALIASGESKIHNVYQIDRGYERIEERLNALGAKIIRKSAE